MSFKHISVIGLGYIGLPTAALFASSNLRVTGVDVNIDVVNTINEGRVHIVEPGLEKIVKKVVKKKYLEAARIPKQSDVFLITVPTPLLESNTGIPKPDLSFIKSAAESIAKVLKKGDLIILESTSPVGTTQELVSWFSMLRPDLSFPKNEQDKPDVNVAYCPERVMPGNAIKELINNDRVIGGVTKRCAQRASKLYKTFVAGECVETNDRTAEMTKLTENSCRDVQIAFANELSIICDSLDIDVWELISLANRHPRINILQPGPGVGGHCIAVDPWFIVSKSPDEAKIIHTSRLVNHRKPYWVLDKIQTAVDEFNAQNNNVGENKVKIALYGLTFKANIDDLRESPSLEIAREVKRKIDCELLLVEPNIKKIQDDILSKCLLNNYECAEKANIKVLLVDHDDFKNLEFRGKNVFKIIDLKGMLN